LILKNNISGKNQIARDDRIFSQKNHAGFEKNARIEYIIR
jgi:hypothetical protein